MRISINHATKTVTVLRYPVQFQDSTFLAFNRGKVLEYVPSSLWVQLINSPQIKGSPFDYFKIKVSDSFKVTYSTRALKGSK